MYPETYKHQKSTVVVYRNHLLPPSETFIRTQSENMQHFDYFYAGTRRVEGLLLPKERVITVHGARILGKVNETIYKLSGVAPGFYKKIKALSPKLVHAHFGPDAVRAMPLSKKLGVPLIATFHGYDATVKPSYAWHSSYSQLIYTLKKQKLQSETARFLTDSDFIKNLLIAQGFPKEKVLTHYVGINTDLFMPDRTTTRERVVLFVGRLVEMKGCEFLIKAMSRVQESFPDTKLVVVGDGPLRQSLEKLAVQNISNFEFLGFRSPTVVKEWMNRAKVFCVPSITAKSGHAEAFGIVFAEAQCMGLPVVSFSSGGISEVVEHGSTGFLALEKDSQALSAYILRLLQDQNVWNKFSDDGRARVKGKFDIKQQTKKLEAIYLDVLDRKTAQ